MVDNSWDETVEALALDLARRLDGEGREGVAGDIPFLLGQVRSAIDLLGRGEWVAVGTDDFLGLVSTEMQKVDKARRARGISWEGEEGEQGREALARDVPRILRRAFAQVTWIDVRTLEVARKTDQAMEGLIANPRWRDEARARWIDRVFRHLGGPTLVFPGDEQMLRWALAGGRVQLEQIEILWSLVREGGEAARQLGLEMLAYAVEQQAVLDAVEPNLGSLDVCIRGWRLRGGVERETVRRFLGYAGRVGQNSDYIARDRRPAVSIVWSLAEEIVQHGMVGLLEECMSAAMAREVVERWLVVGRGEAREHVAARMLARSLEEGAWLGDVESVGRMAVLFRRLGVGDRVRVLAAGGSRVARAVFAEVGRMGADGVG